MGCRVGVKKVEIGNREAHRRMKSAKGKKKQKNWADRARGSEGQKKEKNANYPDRTGDLQMDREVFSLALSQLS